MSHPPAPSHSYQAHYQLTAIVCWCLWMTSLGLPGSAAGFPEPSNTLRWFERLASPMSPEDAASAIRVPLGFHISVFAAEPDVRQPIAMATDAKGRLWVVENYTYGDLAEVYNTNFNDRVLVFEDRDHDGHFDKRTVFWDQAKLATSVEIGMGGVFLLCPPQLLFIPDRNGDGIPDGKPEVLLDGFDLVPNQRHTFANGLKWGPDGWLWGRVGVSPGIHVGRPGTSVQDRVEVRGGIWRYHPHNQIFEVVCHGTTNPWGMDWNEVGEPFCINTVIGHLWHCIQGAHFKRVSGEDINPYTYQLIDQHADHYHFDTGAGWISSRSGQRGEIATGSDSYGGGHAHAGLLIYQGGNWPDEYRGRVLTLNFHGRRINDDRLDRIGSGYIGKHEPDFVQMGDNWFRGTDLIASPDGGAYISDWSDTGECHDNAGVHRKSGRIYKLTYGTNSAKGEWDLTKLADSELIPRLFDKNEWIARQARLQLADRAWEGTNMGPVATTLRDRYGEETDTLRKLRVLWALNILGEASSEWLLQQTWAPDEYVRSWAVRLLAERSNVPGAWGSHQTSSQPSELHEAVGNRLAEMSIDEPSPFVRLYLASASQRLPVDTAERVIGGLVRHDDTTDHNLPLMIWYGMERLIAGNPKLGIDLVRQSRCGILKQLITRRLGEEMHRDPRLIDQVLSDALAAPTTDKYQIAIGLNDALNGLRNVPPPTSWPAFSTSSLATTNIALGAMIGRLAAIFGQAEEVDSLRSTVTNGLADPGIRANAVETLLKTRSKELVPFFHSVLADTAVRIPALIGLIELGDFSVKSEAVRSLNGGDSPEQRKLLNTLTLRPFSAGWLLDAIESGSLPATCITALTARDLANLNDPVINAQLKKIWGTVRDTSQSKRLEIERIKHLFSSFDSTTANLSHGRQLFNQMCSGCHRLYGQGGEVGPDLTGSGRANLDYLLANVVDPNAVVPDGYRLTILTLRDGRTLSGIERKRNTRTITIQTAAEIISFPTSDIISSAKSDQSMMPEGLLESLKEVEVFDLLSYLMADRQVATHVH